MNTINKHTSYQPDIYEYIMNRIKKAFPRRNGPRMFSAMVNQVIDEAREAEKEVEVK